MAPPWRYRVTVNSAALDRLFLPGGDVWVWSRDVGREVMFQAIATAPGRTGLLRSLHGMNQQPGGPRAVRFTVYNDAEYAKFVHNGTTGPITSTRPGGFLLVRPSPYSFFGRFTPLPFVSGQNAQPWLANATEDVMARHGIR